MIKVPNGFDDCVSANDSACSSHQQFQQAKLGRAKMNLSFTTNNLVASRIQDEIADLKHRWARRGTAARNRAQASQENFESKWLGQIVVSADIKTLNDVRHRVSRCEHQDRGPVVILSESARYLETVNHRQ